jgi:alpha-L-rhamnosidase
MLTTTDPYTQFANNHLSSPPFANNQVARITPVSAVTTKNGSCLVTFAENFVGAVAVQHGHVHVSGAGSMSLVHSEVLSDDKDGINVSWTWGNEDIHFLDVAPTGELRPSFTWHGFQFVEVTAQGGVTVDCTPAAFQGSKVHANIESIGNLTFDGSPDGKMLAQLQAIILRGQLSNVAEGIPTDCPTREKHGWLGDAATTAEEAMQNFEMQAVYEEYLNTVRDSQNAGE